MHLKITVTLDEDVAEKVRAEARRSGRKLPEVVNGILRRGLVNRRKSGRSRPFKVVTRSLGKLKAGPDLDSISDLLERVEGANHR